MHTSNFPLWPTLGLFFSAAVLGAHSEIGVKGGYQLYNNDVGNPSSFGKGVFMNVPLTEQWALEGGMLLLGEAKEDNRNIGAFNVAELSAMYFWRGEKGDLFAKVGVTPWFGYMSAPTGGQGYEYGYGGSLGMGYRFPLSEYLNGRVEYQYLPNLGGDTIGFSDSHFISFGLSWRTESEPLLGNEEVVTLGTSDAEVVSSTISAPQDLSIVPSINVSKEEAVRELSGSWSFENNSSTLSFPEPSMVIERARGLISNGCTLLDIVVEGYPNGASESRASKVATYLSQILDSQSEEVKVRSFSRESLNRLSSETEVSLYERRVDFHFRFQCWDK